MNDAVEVTAPGERQVVMTRRFHAPRELVFEAFTKPELIERWLLGPDGWRATEQEAEQAIQQQVLPWKLEGGGVWRLHVPDGAQIFLRLLLFLADFPFPPPPVGVV